MPKLPSEGDAHTAKPGKAKAPTDPWSGRTDLITAPKAKEPSALSLPKVERFTLNNGLKVLVVKDDSLPVVAMSLAVRAGRRNESRDRVGLARFAADMLNKGTRSRSAAKIAETIDFVGGALSAQAGYDATYISCQALSRSVGTCLSLLPDVVVNPTFPKGEMPTVRENLMAEVRGRRDNAGQLAGAHFANALWGEEHPRGWVLSAATVQAIEQGDLKAWHKRWFLPNNAVLAVAGDVDPKKLKNDLNRAFGRWRKGKVEEPKEETIPKLAGYKVRLVDKPDQTQSHIRIGHFGLKLSDRDFYDALVFNYALGGGAFSSRLMKVVRSEAGKTYGASSRFGKSKTRDAFYMTTFTRNVETKATIDLLLQELGKMAAGGPTAKEVKDAIANIAGSYSTSFQSADDYAGALLESELAGFGDDYVRNYALKVGGVTAQSATASAQQRLDPKSLVIVIVGSAKDVMPQLERAGWKAEVVDYMQPVAGYERKALADKQNAPVSSKEQAKAHAILEQALGKKGGAKLGKIKSLKLDAKATLSLGPQTVPVEMSRIMVRPDRLQLVMKVMGGEQIVTVAGEKGWVKQAMGGQTQVQDIPTKDLRAAKSQLWRDQELVLLRFKEAGVIAKVVETTKTHHVVELRKGSWSVHLHINKASKLLDKMTYQEGGEISTEEYSDYKRVGGIMVAHKRKTTQKMMGRAATFDITLSKVQWNPKIDMSVFNKPAK